MIRLAEHAARRIIIFLLLRFPKSVLVRDIACCKCNGTDRTSLIRLSLRRGVIVPDCSITQSTHMSRSRFHVPDSRGRISISEYYIYVKLFESINKFSLYNYRGNGMEWNGIEGKGGFIFRFRSIFHPIFE